MVVPTVHNSARTYVLLNLSGQTISWLFTFVVMRLLDPQDYGLMAMASFLTGYLQAFGELGIGASLIRRADIDRGELSSVFWMTVCIGIVMAASCLVLAYPTAWIFSEPDLVPITQLIGVVFIGVFPAIVPRSLLSRELSWERIGLGNLVAIVVSSVLSVVLAVKGFGVYTLILANAASNLTKLLVFWVFARWVPLLTFKLSDVSEHVMFGGVLSLAGGVSRLFQSLDRLIMGREFGAANLGLYSNAANVAAMPLDKSWPMVNQIIYPLFARMMHRGEDYLSPYMMVVKLSSAFAAAVYLGAIAISELLIEVVLGEKWLPMNVFLQVFCVTKLVDALIGPHRTALTLVGVPRVLLARSVIILVIMVPAIWIAANQSFHAVALPWLVIYTSINVAWILRTAHHVGVSPALYARTYAAALLPAAGMFTMIQLVPDALTSELSTVNQLLMKVGLGGALWLGLQAAFDRTVLTEFLSILKGGADRTSAAEV